MDLLLTTAVLIAATSSSATTPSFCIDDVQYELNVPSIEATWNEGCSAPSGQAVSGLEGLTVGKSSDFEIFKDMTYAGYGVRHIAEEGNIEVCYQHGECKMYYALGFTEHMRQWTLEEIEVYKTPVEIMTGIEAGELNLDNYICGREYDVVIEELHQMYPGGTVTNKLRTVEIEINGEVVVIDCF